ncbi:MAG: aminopeptidase, partial [Eubacterium sp.]|nr:aminopeptidase [Eubacterium sp.]
LDKAFANKRVEATEECYKRLGEDVSGFAGPAVIETFGEKRFSPVSKESVAALSEQQQEISRKMYGEMGEISNKYLPGDSYSFTIIAFPLPDIGDEFEEIFDEVININTLDNEKYKKIQQSIIDTLDKADVVRVIGMNGNRTDMTVKMRKLASPDRETQFENCTADVNIPLGEVFTSPVLEGTHGTLNVSSSYLNGYKFDNIEFKFEDGVVTDYNCDNYISQGSEGIEKGKQYIKENILFNHEFLPIGEFAIGTNTYAYNVARKYDILEKLPILIVEKTGPHFALGDTCYSHAEDHAVFNPDGKEIVSRSNSFADLRETEPEKAYFNCHTDITIPYNELGRLFAVYEDGTEVDIIVSGRFVLPGTEELNAMIDND